MVGMIDEALNDNILVINFYQTHNKSHKLHLNSCDHVIEFKYGHKTIQPNYTDKSTNLGVFW